MSQLDRTPGKGPDKPTLIKDEDGGVRIDGFAQVLAMLEIADEEFRESLLRRLGARDKKLVAALRAELAKIL